MIKQDIAVCGLRYGKTKVQAELIKKYIEENSLTEIKITILDSESKQKLDKIKELVNKYGYYTLSEIPELLSIIEDSNEETSKQDI